MGIRDAETDLLIGREALHTQLPEGKLAACPAERS